MPTRTVQLDGHRLRLTNLDKVLYPRTDFTKAQLISYYARVAPSMIGHLRGRPVTLRRFPDGVEGESFYQKNCPAHRPAWLRTAHVASASGGDDAIDYCLLDEPAALAWAANLAAIELHVPLHRVDRPHSPTALVLDLDPTAPAGFAHCVQAAFELKPLLERLDLVPLAKHSGGKGLHLYAALPQPSSYDQSRHLARTLARLLAQRHRKWVTDRMSKAQRGGKVFIDWSQNTASKTTVCVYSLRAQSVPRVSAPMTWHELTAWLDNPDTPPPTSSPEHVIQRLDEQGDLFAPLGE